MRGENYSGQAKSVNESLPTLSCQWQLYIQFAAGEVQVDREGVRRDRQCPRSGKFSHTRAPSCWPRLLRLPAGAAIKSMLRNPSGEARLMELVWLAPHFTLDYEPLNATATASPLLSFPRRCSCKSFLSRVAGSVKGRRRVGGMWPS